MRGAVPGRVRRVSVSDPIAAARRYDYADAFELRLDGPDGCSPEEWVRAGVDATPTWIKRIAGSADGLDSARIVESDADLVVLEDSDPLMETVMIGRNVAPERRVLTTVLHYRRRMLARPVWAVVGILHRRTARRLVAGRLPASGSPRPAGLARVGGVAVPGVLIGIAAIHATWALGWHWPAGSERELAEYVLSSGERERLDGELPPAPITWLVALGLTGAAAVVRAVAGGTRSRTVRAAGWSVAAVFLARGLIYPPLDVIGGLDDRYDRLDLAIYSPLSLGIAIATAVVLRRAMYDDGMRP